MAKAYETLQRLVDQPDFYDVDTSPLPSLWLEAANERLAEQRERIPVLGRLVDELGVTTIDSFDDLVPLLFAHSSYKSYPEAFVAKSHWVGMNRWLDALSSGRIDVDVDGVADQDQWIERLADHGHVVFASSGTTGKSSFLPGSTADSEFSLNALVTSFGARRGLRPNQELAVFILGPKYGPHRAASHFRAVADAYGRPDPRFFLTDEPMRMTEISRMALLRRKMADGSALPSEIAACEQETALRQRDMDARLDGLIDELLAHRREPMIIGGFWAQYWTIVDRARARGIRPGEFHPNTIITGGGGTKGAVLPDDYEAQVLEFFGISRENVQSGYGMSELSAACSEVAGRYRSAPWVIPLLLDDSGQKLLDVGGGEVQGRFGFFDTAIEGRWGGVVTGDRVTVDPTGPTFRVVPGSIERYSATAGGDDKLTCAGTIDAYVRGAVSS